MPLYAASFALLLYALWANRRYPGMSLAFVGSLMNGVVILVNGGYMPVWEPSLLAAGFTPADVSPALHYRAAAGARCELPPPSRTSRRRHPDPGAGAQQRRVGR